MAPTARTCCVAQGPRRHWTDQAAWTNHLKPGLRDAVILPTGAHIPRAEPGVALCHRLIVFEEPRHAA